MWALGPREREQVAGLAVCSRQCARTSFVDRDDLLEHVEVLLPWIDGREVRHRKVFGEEDGHQGDRIGLASLRDAQHQFEVERLVERGELADHLAKHVGVEGLEASLCVDDVG